MNQKNYSTSICSLIFSTKLGFDVHSAFRITCMFWAFILHLKCARLHYFKAIATVGVFINNKLLTIFQISCISPKTESLGSFLNFNLVSTCYGVK